MLELIKPGTLFQITKETGYFFWDSCDFFSSEHIFLEVKEIIIFLYKDKIPYRDIDVFCFFRLKQNNLVCIYKNYNMLNALQSFLTTI